MCVFKIVSDADAIEICNDCSFGLGSNVFSSDARRANKIAAELKCGMSSINDFATSYMCQSLPWGGVKDSGFLSFAGVKGCAGVAQQRRWSRTSGRSPLTSQNHCN